MRRHSILNSLQDIAPTNWSAYLMMIIAETELGDDAQARKHAAEVIRLQPAFSLSQLQPISSNQEEFQHELADLRRAGLN